MRRSQRTAAGILSLLLLAALLLSLFPLAAFAEEPAEDGTEEKGNLWGIPADDVIWFGVYKDEPVAWLVLDAGQTNMGTEGVFLLTQDLIDRGEVVYDKKSTLWEGSLAQQWCTDFAGAAFSSAESALVPYTDKHEDETYLYVLAWRAVDLKKEQVFFLSVIELEQYFGSYGTNKKITVKRSSLDSYYWLRSPIVYHDDYHGMVMQNNTVHDYLPNHHWSARPCINLSLQDAVWVLPAEDPGLPGPVALPESAGSGEWKLLVPLAEHGFRAETVSADPDGLTLRYSGADTGEGTMLSLLTRDRDGKALSLRRLGQPTAAEGELRLNRSELELPEGASLFLFCEQTNGEKRSNYASPLQELKTELSPPEATAAGEDAEPGNTDEPGEDEGTIELVRDEPETTPPKAGFLGSLEKEKLLGLAACVLGAALTVVLLVTAVRRHSLNPVILLVLLAILASVILLRLRYGQPPSA